MNSAEPSSSIKPCIDEGNTKLATHGTRSYRLAACALFIMILLLCINNLILFRSYKQIKQQFIANSRNVEMVSMDNTNIKNENEKLMKEINILRQNNEKLIDESKEITKQINEIRRINDELMKRNKELTDDNIALQNSLKMAAAAGIKPQNYTKFEGLNSRSEIDRGNYIGKFLGTAYTPSKDECGNNKGITNSGKPIIPGISVAVDSRYWPFGTVFYIKGLGYAVAMDTGNAIKGKYRFDFSVFDKKFARTLGSRKWDVYLVRLGKGDVSDISF